MKTRVAINGFGRIGRTVFRIIHKRSDIEVVAINDITPNETLAYLLRYDTIMGPFPAPVEYKNDSLMIGSHEIRMYSEKDPASLPWKELKVDVAIECTGVFKTREMVQKHIDAGAKRMILCVPPKDNLDAMIVLGVNDEILNASTRLVSNASCTTNCLAPVAKVLHENFGIEYGTMTTVHAYTNDQRLSDFPHSDLRRARAANENIIPTTTGAARAVGKVLPALAGRLDGQAMRVPLADGSIVDLVAKLQKNVTVKDIQLAMKKAAEGPMKGILQYTEEPIVSSDIIGNPHSSIFDAPLTQVLDGNFVKVISWYDNEYGYSSRVVDLAVRMAHLDQ